MKNLKTKIRSKNGVAMLETVLVSALFMIFFAYLFSGSQLASNRIVLDYATETATRRATPAESKSEADKIIKNQINEILKSCGIDADNVNIKTEAGTWKQGNFITTNVTISYQTLFPIPINGTNFVSTTQNLSTSFKGMIEFKK